MGGSNEERTLVVRGRTIGEAHIEIVRRLIAENPERGITYLSSVVAERWGWKHPDGRVKDRACRAVLAALKSRGLIQYPRETTRKVGRTRSVSSCSPLIPQVNTTRLEGCLAEFLPLRFELVSDEPNHRLWDYVVRKFHYLGYRILVGRNLKYLVYAGDRLIAALGWQSAVGGHLACRDQAIGWDSAQRQTYVHRVANNSRFLIMPWIRILHAASHILARNIARLNRDWEAKYGYPLWLLECFVDPSLYRGTCYRAANWVCIGQTKGFRKEKEGFAYHGATKEVYVYVLDKRARQKIQADSSAPLLTREFLLSVRIENLSSKRRGKLILRHEGWKPDIPPHCEMTPEDIDHLADKLEEFHALFEGSFKRVEQLGLSRHYLQGLLTDLERKSVEPIALALDGPSEVRNLQRFMSDYKWDLGYMAQRYWEEASKTIAAPDGVLSVDSSEFPKKGRESVGVSRQYCGRLGKIENCQSGVFVAYASSLGYALLDRRLFMPENWFSEEQKERRQKCKVPEELTFKTKPQIAAELIQGIWDSGLFPCRWVTCDTVFGNSPDFVGKLPKGLYYLAEVVHTTKVWIDPLPTSESCSRSYRSLSEIAQDPALSWFRKTLAEGAKGPIVAEVARVRVRPSKDDDPDEDEQWLFLRKDPISGEIKHCLSNAPEDIPLDEMVRVCILRWPVEQLFGEGKSELGMDHYEHRSWLAWHRHMTFVALAQLFLLQTRIEFKKKAPALTLPQARLIINAILPVIPYDRNYAIEIIEYYTRRNYIAYRSHRKTTIERLKKLGLWLE